MTEALVFLCTALIFQVDDKKKALTSIYEIGCYEIFIAHSSCLHSKRMENDSDKIVI